jgi:glycerol-3-phosphate acyltransferase PlsY
MPPVAASHPLLPVLAAAIAGYFLGALAFGYWIARARGVDIFSAGSKSPGATNVVRVLGKPAGYSVFVLDVLKGALAAGWPLLVLPDRPRWAHVLGAVGLICALVGHSFSCFTRFRGGKGVAAGAGGFLVLMPLVTVIGAAIWILMFFGTRYVSLASIAAAVTLPICAAVGGEYWFLIVIAVAVAVFVTVRHRANIARLLAGTENKSGRKHPEALR